MSHSRFTLCCLVALAMSVSCECLFGDDARPPNIVFILADDFGYGDLGCYGHPYARTPNIDQLAREGTRFEQFYSTGVTCCPARTGLMTSKFPATFATYPANGGFGAAEHPDVVKKLSAQVETWVATLPKEYIKTNDTND